MRPADERFKWRRRRRRRTAVVASLFTVDPTTTLNIVTTRSIIDIIVGIDVCNLEFYSLHFLLYMYVVALKKCMVEVTWTITFR
jgi:hypothetical protein